MIVFRNRIPDMVFFGSEEDMEEAELMGEEHCCEGKVLGVKWEELFLLETEF